jgi:hypothetical protein
MPISCLYCASENIVVSKKRGVNFCEDCGHEFPADKPFAALRIFLSYGHDANEELVRRIKADLEKRGHDVWFDKSTIKAGDDWRRSITSGITECDRFFSFLSKHSTRDPGVRIAIGAKGGNIQSILVESEQEVKLPPSISHIQWLDMHDWKEHGKIGDAAWEQWYQKKFDEIKRVVESDESRKFAGEIRTLEEYLKPVVSDFAADARIQKLLEKKLTGRAWLFEAVEKWRTAADRNSRIFWMMGTPGFGKSFFAAHLAHFYGRGTVIGVHFCAYDKPDHRSAPRIIRTLAFQLATRLPDYRKLLLTLPEIAELDRKQTAAELFDYLLANPLKLTITGGRERLLIVIDALDEAGGGGRNELVEMLARHAPSLPDWIGLVVTSRPESDVRAPLQGLNPFVLDTATEANRADLREYLRHELAPQLQPRPDADRLVEQILEKSEGVFLYAERFCDDVQRGHLSLDHPDQFPQGLGGIFFQWFQRQFPDLEKFRKNVRPGLRAILAAREPLPVEILQRLFNWQDEELRDFTRPLGSLFPVAKEVDNEVIKPYHKSIPDWLADESKAGAFFVSVKEGHRTLAKLGEARLATLSDTATLDGGDNFLARGILFHCYEAELWDELVRCVENPSFFWKIAKPRNGIGYLQYVLFGFHTAEKQLSASSSHRLTSQVCWKLANALGERTKELQAGAFGLAKKHDEGTNTIRNHLKQNHPAEFERLRDIIYSFAELAGVTAQFACAATCDESAPHQAQAKSFLNRFSTIHSYLHYLSDFASTEGWSGALESEATEAYFPWERLMERAKSDAREETQQ